MKQPLLIYGAGGLGREILSLVRTSGGWEPVGFLDDAVPVNQVIRGVPVLGGIEALLSFDGPRNIVVAVGQPAIKQDIVRLLKPHHVHYPVLMHPAAILQDPESVMLGEGVIIGAGCILTTDICVGSHVLINLNSTIGHDVRIGDCTSIMCGVNVAGEVTIGSAVMIGSGASVLNRITIGDRSRIGMGAAVVKDVADNVTVVGVPAKRTGE